MLSKAAGNGIPEGDKHRLWLLVMAGPVSPGGGNGKAGLGWEQRGQYASFPRAVLSAPRVCPVG